MFQVLLGGGRQYFLPKSVVDPEINKTDKDQRRDGRHLINVRLVYLLFNVDNVLHTMPYFVCLQEKQILLFI